MKDFVNRHFFLRSGHSCLVFLIPFSMVCLTRTTVSRSNSLLCGSAGVFKAETNIKVRMAPDAWICFFGDFLLPTVDG